MMESDTASGPRSAPPRQVSIKLRVPGLTPDHLPLDYLARLRASLLEATAGCVRTGVCLRYCIWYIGIVSLT